MELAVRPSADTRVSANTRLRASIIIVNYNAREKLLRCLESVLSSSGLDCEVIVVDNDSSDGIADIIETDLPMVRLIRSRTNLGFGAGNNLAALEAHGTHFVFLNPDTLVERGWLEALLAPFDTDPGVGLVTSKILLAQEPARINTCGNTVHFTGLTLCRGLGDPREAFDEIQEVHAVSGAAFAIRSELFKTLEGFDEDTFLYMEDTDLSLRARLAGWSCLLAPDSVVHHHYSLRITPYKIFYQERNRYLMLLKTFRWPTLLLLLPAHVLAEVISWGFVVYNDRANFTNKLRAYRWIIANWQGILRKRMATQALRCVTDRHLLRHTTYRLEFGLTSKSGVAKLARVVFNPLFLMLKGLAMLLIWW